jgi:hypothetical protein
MDPFADFQWGLQLPAPLGPEAAQAAAERARASGASAQAVAEAAEAAQASCDEYSCNGEICHFGGWCKTSQTCVCYELRADGTVPHNPALPRSSRELRVDPGDRKGHTKEFFLSTYGERLGKKWWNKSPPAKPSIPAPGMIDPDEKARLTAVLRQANLPGLTAAGTRNPRAHTGDPCDGSREVSCDADGRVIGLDLGRRGLKGPFPSEILALRRLRMLYLDHNALTGPIPADLCARLPHLTDLLLHRSGLSGPIPDSIGRCSRLATLAAYGNKMSGELPASIGRLGRLRYLDLSRNRIGGTLPAAALEGLWSLEALYLDHNRIEGHIPREIGTRLTALKTLRLENNRFVDGLRHVGGGLRVFTDALLDRTVGDPVASPQYYFDDLDLADGEGLDERAALGESARMPHGVVSEGDKHGDFVMTPQDYESVDPPPPFNPADALTAGNGTPDPRGGDSPLPSFREGSGEDPKAPKHSGKPPEFPPDVVPGDEPWTGR